MSSWQQAVSDDVRRGKRRACPVVMNSNQEKNIKTGREDPDGSSWTCDVCAHTMSDSFYRCQKCQNLKPEERAFRLEMRAKGGEIGKGGGYNQRSAANDRKEWNSDDEEYDEFGRRKKRKAGRTLNDKERAMEGQKTALARRHERNGGSRGVSRSQSTESAGPDRGKAAASDEEE
eukprot:CAMPEP_0172720686 /NCGR_PEP_ID=MMETSP1074-20121228/77460_1 /TAXON_ID=2916 /ORGANISM="Ceratium fusus, Strain PA161109" /LENGTH=174 /DNA_ID=CAMNT_0013546253 /DNA_START=37 /DNA_END=562 /DNA_ORIENTATION=+